VSPTTVLALFVSLIVLSAGACDDIAIVGPEDEPKISLEPIRVDGRVNVRIVHSDWPGNRWQYRFPEYMIVSAVTGDLLWPTPWHNPTRGSVRLSGSRGGPDPAEYSFVIQPRDEFIDVMATVTNTGSRPWNAGAFALACLVFGDSPQFFDAMLEQTRAHFDGEFLDIKTARHRSGITGANIEEFRQSAHVLRAEDVGWRDEPDHSRRDIVDCSLIVRSSKDGLHHVAHAWEDAFSVSYNLEDRKLNCIHSNPRFGAVEPGQSRTVHGRVYFVAGTIEALFERFLEDFSNRGYERESRGSVSYHRG
jgi:hypothetical protein